MKKQSRRLLAAKAAMWSAMWLVAILGLSASPAWAQYPSKSPNGFFANQCTWSADWTSYLDFDWRLDFSRSYNRDAKKWAEPGLIRNAYLGFTPEVGNIMVLNNSARGHVAVVKDLYSEDGYEYVLVYHSNWPVPGSNDTRPRYQWFEINLYYGDVRPIYSRGRVGRWVPVIGFLKRAWY